MTRAAGLLFALVTGIILFLFVQRLTTPAGGLMAAAYYFLLPLAVTNSQALNSVSIGLASLLTGLWSLTLWVDSRRGIYAV